MAKVKTKSSKSESVKKLKDKEDDQKKLSKEGPSTSKSGSSQLKTNLKRGKVPSNWNTYLENNSCSTSKKPTSKIPKNKTIPTNNENSDINMPKMEQLNTKSTGRCIAIDCEMVGINEGGRDHMLARVSLVDENGAVVYDTFVKPTQRVIDYRTAVSGVRPADLANGRDFKVVQSEVFSILQGKLLVGHAIRNDLKVLYLQHNKKYVRDTSKFTKFRDETNGMTPSLKFLSSRFLGTEIQSGEHSSIEDARAAMFLYMKFRNVWESEIRTKKYK